jgi:hypothetical protein
VAAAHTASDCWATPDRGPWAAFNMAAHAWQLREAASLRVAATQLWCPDKQAPAE